MTEVDDIQSFIAAQKRRIEEERAELSQGNVVRRNVGNPISTNFKTPQENSTSVRRQEQPKAEKQDLLSPSGLAFGAYENVQEKLRKERAEEYKNFLAQKNYRTTGQNSPRDKEPDKSSLRSTLHKQDYNQESARGLSKDDPPFSSTHMNEKQRRPLDGKSDELNRPRVGRARPEKTMDELYDAYEELLERKRQDERKYRGVMDDSFLDPRRVRFDDEFKSKPLKETWMENGRRRWDLDNGIDHVGGRRPRDRDDVDTRTFGDNQEKSSRSKNQNPEEDRISRSAPPKAVPLFGEHDMSPEVKQQRQTKYREELQAQIKEREMQKKREKNHRFVGDFQAGEEKSVKPPGNQDLTARGYQPSVPRQENRLPASQLGFDQPYNNPYMPQPYNYPSGLLPSAPPMSTFNSSGMLPGYPMSFREPVAGYQPSWANNPLQTQRTNGMGNSLGRAGEVGQMNQESRSRQVQSTGGEKNLYSGGISSIGALPSQTGMDKEKDRSRQQSYREELTRQMMEKETRKKKDKEDVERYNMKLEQEIAEYNPWGKAGGGAPIKDQTGRLVSDLRKMHQYNKEGTIISPRDHGAKHDLYVNKDHEGFASDVVKTTASNTVSQQNEGRLPIQTDEPQKKSQLEYQEHLRQQVEEKQRKKKEEQERLRELDARQDKIIQEQQEKQRNEYEKELQNSKRKEEAARLKNEEIKKAAEEKKKELQQKRLEEDRKQEERLRKQLDERLKAAKAKNTDRSASLPMPTLQGDVRSTSPPIPTLRREGEEGNRTSSPPVPALLNQMRSNSPPIPTLQQNKESERPSEQVSRAAVERQASFDRQTPRPSSNTSHNQKQTDYPESLPLTPRVQARNTKRTDQELGGRPPSVTADIDVLSQLTSLRRQLKNEEIKVQQQLSENKEKYAKLRENNGSRRGKKPVGNVFDNALRKKPAVSQKDQDLKNFGAMDEFNKLKYEDSSSLHGDFISRYPDPATSNSTLDLQQKSLLREQQKRLQVFRDTLSTTDKENVELFGNSTRPTSKTSQLESDSQFVSVEDPSQVVVGKVETSKPPVRISSARERRRWKQLEQLAKGSKLSDYKPPTPGGFSLNSVTSFNVDELAQKNEERLRRLEAMKQARSESNGDPNEVLKKFIQQHSRPDSKVSENSLPADKRYLPNM